MQATGRVAASRAPRARPRRRARTSRARTANGPSSTSRGTSCATRRAARRSASSRASMRASRRSTPRTTASRSPVDSGERVTYDPRRLQGVTLYREADRAFAVGDRVQFTAPYRERHVANRELGTLEQIDASGRLHAAARLRARGGLHRGRPSASRLRLCGDESQQPRADGRSRARARRHRARRRVSS